MGSGRVKRVSQDCIFCKIGKGEIESEVLYRDDSCFVIKDIAPKAPVHMLVIPNRHFTYLEGLTQSDYAMVGAMFGAAKEIAAREDLSGSGYRLIVNQGDDAGQAVEHLHLHVLGGKQLGAMG